jgi:hypothetical protein
MDEFGRDKEGKINELKVGVLFHFHYHRVR